MAEEKEYKLEDTAEGMRVVTPEKSFLFFEIDQIDWDGRGDEEESWESPPWETDSFDVWLKDGTYLRFEKDKCEDDLWDGLISYADP